MFIFLICICFVLCAPVRHKSSNTTVSLFVENFRISDGSQCIKSVLVHPKIRAVTPPAWLNLWDDLEFKVHCSENSTADAALPPAELAKLAVYSASENIMLNWTPALRKALGGQVDQIWRMMRYHDQFEVPMGSVMPTDAVDVYCSLWQPEFGVEDMNSTILLFTEADRMESRGVCYKLVVPSAIVQAASPPTWLDSWARLSFVTTCDLQYNSTAPAALPRQELAKLAVFSYYSGVAVAEWTPARRACLGSTVDQFWVTKIDKNNPDQYWRYWIFDMNYGYWRTMDIFEIE